MPNFMDLFGGVSVFAKLTMAVAIAAFAVAVSHVFRPSGQTLALLRPVSLAAIFAAVSGVLAGWIVVLGGIAATPAGSLSMPRVYRGIAESLTVGFVCFGFLAAAWLLVALGTLRRGSVDME